MAEDQARWMADLLATSIQVSGLSEEELERRLGWAAGSVGRFLEGEERLEPEQVLRALAELNVEAAPEGPEFAEMEDGRTQVVTDLLERFRQLGYELEEVTPPPDVRTDLPELEKRVESILRKAFGSALDED